MILLDENLHEQHQQALLRLGIRTRHIGYDLSHRGIKDEQILPLLHRLHRATVFTRDLGLYRREFCHHSYCLVCLAVLPPDVPRFIRRVLRHPDLNTRAKGLGKLIYVSPGGVRYWVVNGHVERRLKWNTSSA